MKTNSEKHTFRVIIVGGGLGGLALARALDLGGIDFVLLEARDVIDPAMGASMYVHRRQKIVSHWVPPPCPEIAIS